MLHRIVAQLKAMQIYYQFAHNVVSGISFFADHVQFAKFYDECQEDYDQIAEVTVSVEGPENLCPEKQLKTVYAIIKELGCNGIVDAETMFTTSCKAEESLATLLKAANDKGVSLGCEAVLGDIAKRSAMRIYLINQRLAK